MDLENDSCMVPENYKTYQEKVKCASRNSSAMFNSSKHRISTQFNTRSMVVQSLEFALEEQLKNLQHKMADLINSSHCDLTDDKTQQSLLEKVNELRTDFERCSQLLTQTKKSEKSTTKDTNNQSSSRNTSVLKSSYTNRRMNFRKNYLNSTPVVNYEIYKDEYSTPRVDITLESPEKSKCMKEDAIRKSLTRIIEKNTQKMNSNKSTERYESCLLNHNGF